MLLTPLGRWRLVALTVGTLLVILVFVGVPLKYGADDDSVASIVGVTHGFLYMLYVVLTLDLWRRQRWPLQKVILAVAAGLVPIMTFVMERKVTREAEENRPAVRP